MDEEYNTGKAVKMYLIVMGVIAAAGVVIAFPPSAMAVIAWIYMRKW